MSFLKKVGGAVSSAVTGGAFSTTGQGWAQNGDYIRAIPGVGSLKELQGQPPKPTTQPNYSGLIPNGSTIGKKNAEELYGQSKETTGKKIQKGAKGFEERLEGTDAVSEAMRQQKNQSMANVGRQIAGRGYSGGLAAAAMEQAGRQKDIDISATAYNQQAQNLKDYTNLQSNIAANQGMIEQMSIQNQLASIQPQLPQQQKGFLGSLLG